MKPKISPGTATYPGYLFDTKEFMKYRSLPVALISTVLLLGANLSMAADTKAAAPQQAASKAAASKSKVAAKPKVAAKTKLVDINTAKSEELKTLPGITDAEAAKIIAGRPYASKADLVVRKLIDDGAYENLKKLIIAKQPNKDAAKNAALYSKKK